MSLWRGLRWSTAWLFLPLIALSAYAAAISEREFFGDYPLVALSQAWVSLVVVGPLLAGWTAWDSARLRPWLDSAFGGAHRGKALLRALGLAAAVAMAFVTTVVVFATGWPSGSSTWVVVLAALLTMTATAVFGAALGCVVPRLIAVPLAVATTYGALGIAVADPSAWLGRVALTGVLAPCCTSAEQIRPAALGYVSAIALLVLCGGLFVCTAPIGRPARAATLVGLFVLTAGFSWFSAQELGPSGQLTARTTPLDCRKGEDVEVCVWPEHADDLPQVVNLVSSVRTEVSSLGITLPARWSESERSTGALFMWASGVSDHEHRYALGLDIAHLVGCTKPENEVQMAALIALQLDVPAGQIAQGDPRLRDFVRDVATLSDDARGMWMSELLDACQR